MSDPAPAGNGLRRAAGVALRKHLEALRIADLREVHAFWQPDAEALEVPKRDLVERLQEAMSHEGTVYRRVGTLTRKVLDVLLLLLRRAGYGSALPGHDLAVRSVTLRRGLRYPSNDPPTVGTHTHPGA